MTQQGSPGFSAEVTSQEGEALITGRGGEFNAFTRDITIVSTTVDAGGVPTTQLRPMLILKGTDATNAKFGENLGSLGTEWVIIRFGTNMLNPITGVAEDRNNQPAYWKGTFRLADVYGSPDAQAVTDMKAQGIDLV